VTFPARYLVLSALAALFAVGLQQNRAKAADNADAVASCLTSERVKSLEGARAWWKRRTPEEQRVVLAVPCDERYIPLTCIFLYEPDLIGCTNKGVAEKRATAACQAKGLELLSPAMTDCTEKFKKTFKAPLSGASS
jgi:hypothetical protein